MNAPSTNRANTAPRFRDSVFMGLVSLLLLASSASAAPPVDRIEPGKVQLNGWGGWQWGGAFSGDEGKIDIDSGPSFGTSVELRVQDDGFAFISYSLQRTRGNMRFNDGTSSKFDLDVGYIQIGGVLDIPMSLHFVPYIGLSLGASYLSPRVADTKAKWFFAGSALAGAKFPITRHFGLRTQMRFLGTVIGGDTNFFCSSNGGATCGLHISNTTGIIQGDITGGLYLSF